MGATYLVLAPEHSLVDSITTSEQKEAVRRYKEQVVGKSDMDRTSTGVNNGKTGAFFSCKIFFNFQFVIHLFF
jgi:leucyl-tRNA synthetase